jgi:hypothetical protein
MLASMTHDSESGTGVADDTSTVADDLPARQFGWWDMFVSPEDDPREAGEPPEGERATLVRPASPNGMPKSAGELRVRPWEVGSQM